MVEWDGGKVEFVTALHIRNEEACRLIRELADLEGRSMTAVVIAAVQEKLDRERYPQINEERMQYFLDLGRQFRESADPEWLERDDIAELHDEETGLPK